ncbi:class I SAM-dependent methyltransferase [Nibrella saemangeumensis]|uniref:Class I SAM-dependent methyltransferase n=1 Tax=Nibrella saemangeumensis TaxID=1084526 RepID=A0ABP8MYR9_9BACT
MSIIQVVRPFVPASLRRIVKNLYISLEDQTELWLGKRDALTPPRSKIFIGGGDFKAIGQEFKRLFIEYGELKPHHNVLDIGCGIGRMAVPLTNYLNESGSYEGIDIVKMGIDWCRKHITPRFPNFRFQQADVYNSHYNPTGRYQAYEYQLPYPDNQFDFIFLTSVFTHMPPREIDQYLAEINRVMKSGGRCFATFFILNDESRRLMTSPESVYNFKHAVDGRYVHSTDDPDICSAVDETVLRAMLSSNNLTSLDPILYGTWCSRKDGISFQDIVLIEKL